MVQNSEQYSLTELCFKLDLSHAWIKKIEGYFNLSWGSGQRGRRSYYSWKEYHFFNKVKLLRFLGLSLKDIKDMFDMEYEIQNYLYKHFNPDNPDDSTQKLKDKTNLPPIHRFDVYLTNSIFGKALYENHISNTYETYKASGKVEAARLDKMYSDYRAIVQKVNAVAQDYYRTLGEDVKTLAVIVTDGGK